MCLGPAAVPATEKAANYRTAIRVLLVIQTIVVILNFVAAASFLREAIFGIFFFFLLYIMQHQLSYQVIMIFIFISIFFAIDFMVYFLTPIQNQQDFRGYSGMDKFAYADSIFSFLYYSFCAVFCFYPYREFKAIEYNNNPALRNYFERNEREEPPQENNNKGAAKTVNYDVNYGDIKYDERKRNNDNGTFEVFKGQGVKIG
jgi:hypothetical protein